MSEIRATEIHSYKYGNNVINFRLKYSDRKSIGISVSPSCHVEVIAPIQTNLNTIVSAVENRAKWIVKQLEYFSSFDQEEGGRDYKSGISIKYFGRDFMFVVSQVEAYHEELIEIVGDQLVLSIHNRNDQKRINLFVEDWLRNEALIIVSKFVEANFQKIKKYGVIRPQFYLRKMKRRWGSCTIEKVLFFNPEIVTLPKPLISYVVMHELCHLKFQDHSKDFYNLLETLMPDWEQLDNYLEFSI